MSETPEPDEIQPGPPPGPPDQPGGPTEILPAGEQSEATEAPRPSWPDPAAPDAGDFAPPGSTAAGPGQGYTFAEPGGAFASQDATLAGQGSTFAGQPRADSAPADPRSVTGPAPVLMGFGPPASQQRVTVAFRAILAIPHLIVLIALVVAAEVVAFIGWWAALFTGQLPPWAHEFITGVLRWQSRVYGYLYFLTDQYPPFSLDDADYPVRLFTKQTRLNRLAVLFRVILMIPAVLLGALAGFGILLVSIVAWLITLIAGRMPAGLHQAFAAVIRFTARLGGYVFLVTPEYPGGLFGDTPSVAAGVPATGAAAALDAAAPEEAAALDAAAPEEPAAPDAAAPEEAAALDAAAPEEPAALDAAAPEEPAALDAAAPEEAAAPDAAAPEEAAAADAAAPEEAAAPDAAAAEEPAAGAETAGEATAPQESASAGDPWRLVLPGNAKALVTVTLVVGLLGLGGYVGGLVAITGSAVNTAEQQANAYNTVTTAYNHLRTVVGSFEGKVQACDENLTCVTKLDGQVAKAFQTFGSQLQGAGVPSSDSGEASALTLANTGVVNGFNMLAGAQSASQYSSVASSVNLEGYLDNWQRDYNQLSKSLKPAH
jgi:hypothetical protein